MKNLKFILILIILTNCSPFSEFKAPEEEKGSPGLFSKDSKKGLSLGDMIFKDKDDQSSSFYVNAYLWRASLEVASIAPLISTDAFGGTIISDWYINPKTKNKKIKLAVFIKSQELRSDGISVKAYVQTLNNNEWSETIIDKNLGLKIEEIILNKAREMRLNSNQ